MPDTVPLYVRITPEQQAKLQRIAASKDRPVAWVIRNMIDRVTEG
jgi:predicted transcriptional regulator